MDFRDVEERLAIVTPVLGMTTNSDALEMNLISLAKLEAHRDFFRARTVKMSDRAKF